jgi:hypothetical protein
MVDAAIPRQALELLVGGRRRDYEFILATASSALNGDGLATKSLAFLLRS